MNKKNSDIFELEALEPRIMLSGEGLASVAMTAQIVEFQSEQPSESELASELTFSPNNSIAETFPSCEEAFFEEENNFAGATQSTARQEVVNADDHAPGVDLLRIEADCFTKRLLGRANVADDERCTADGHLGLREITVGGERCRDDRRR